MGVINVLWYITFLTVERKNMFPCCYVSPIMDGCGWTFCFLFIYYSAQQQLISAEINENLSFAVWEVQDVESWTPYQVHQVHKLACFCGFILHPEKNWVTGQDLKTFSGIKNSSGWIM